MVNPWKIAPFAGTLSLPGQQGGLAHKQNRYKNKTLPGMKSNFIKYNFIWKGDQGFKEIRIQYAQMNIYINNINQIKSSYNHCTTFCENSENYTNLFQMKCNGYRMIR